MSFVSGGYEIPLAVVSLVLTTPLLVLFASNRHLYPLKQREPILAAAAAAGHTVMVSEWFLDSDIAAIPYIARKIITTTAYLFIFSGFFIRAWLLWMDTNLAKERVQGKEGWFIRHRRFRSPSFLNKMKLGFVLFHAAQLTMACSWGSYTNLMPARVGTLFDPTVLYSVIPIFMYFIAFVVFSFLLAKSEDGFFIKFELRVVGAGCGGVTAIWFCWLFFRLPCSFPNCRIFILWISMVWMTTWTLIFPLRKAMQDPRFSYVRWAQDWGKTAKRLGRTSSRSERESSQSGSRSAMEEFQYEEESQEAAPVAPVRKLSEASMTKLKHVSLASFLTYPAGKEAFRAFTVKEFSVENLLFVEAVQAFQSNPSRTKAECQTVYDKFIVEGSSNQVNLPSVVVQRITARIGDLEAGETMNGLFDDAAVHIMKLMQRDAFKRFQLTEAWFTHIVVFKVEDKKPANSAAEAAPVATTATPTTLQVEVAAPIPSEAAGIAMATLPAPAYQAQVDPTPAVAPAAVAEQGNPGETLNPEESTPAAVTEADMS